MFAQLSPGDLRRKLLDRDGWGEIGVTFEIVFIVTCLTVSCP